MEALLVTSGICAWKYITSLWIRHKMMDAFEYAGKVDSLYIYPVKGCGGISVEEAQCRIKGIRCKGFDDRSLMIVEIENGTGLHRNMKHFPSLVFLTAKLAQDEIILNAPDMPPITLPSPTTERNRHIQCIIHGERITVQDGGHEVSDWLKTYLKTDKDIRLVYPSNISATRATGKIARPWKNSAMEYDELQFQYFSPFHITNTKSLDDLNTRLTSPIPMDNFRPNIVVAGNKAFEEDDWVQINIGSKLILRIQDPCNRCLITGLTHRKDKEPPAKNEVLRTLRTFRKNDAFGTDPLFGIYGAIDEHADTTIRVGDPVFVLRRKK